MNVCAWVLLLILNNCLFAKLHTNVDKVPFRTRFYHADFITVIHIWLYCLFLSNWQWIIAENWISVWLAFSFSFPLFYKHTKVHMKVEQDYFEHLPGNSLTHKIILLCQFCVFLLPEFIFDDKQWSRILWSLFLSLSTLHHYSFSKNTLCLLVWVHCSLHKFDGTAIRFVSRFGINGTCAFLSPERSY